MRASCFGASARKPCAVWGRSRRPGRARPLRAAILLSICERATIHVAKQWKQTLPYKEGGTLPAGSAIIARRSEFMKSFLSHRNPVRSLVLTGAFLTACRGIGDGNGSPGADDQWKKRERRPESVKGSDAAQEKRAQSGPLSDRPVQPPNAPREGLNYKPAWGSVTIITSEDTILKTAAGCLQRHDRRSPVRRASCKSTIRKTRLTAIQARLFTKPATRLSRAKTWL